MESAMDITTASGPYITATLPRQRDIEYFTSNDLKEAELAIASTFGETIASCFSASANAHWNAVDTSFIHPIHRVIFERTSHRKIEAGEAAKILATAYAAKFIKGQDVRKALAMSWEVLIGMKPPMGGFTQGDHDTFHRNFAGPTLASGDSDRLWKIASKIHMLAQREMNIPNLTNLMRNAFRNQFGFDPDDRHVTQQTPKKITGAAAISTGGAFENTSTGWKPYVQRTTSEGAATTPPTGPTATGMHPKRYLCCVPCVR